MSDSTDFVKLWMETFGVPVPKPDFEYNGLEASLIKEEFNEWRLELTARGQYDRHQIIKELGDLMWTCKFYLWSMGVDPNEVERRIYKSNSSKLGPDGKPIRNEDGKIMKGPMYMKPNLSGL